MSPHDLCRRHCAFKSVYSLLSMCRRRDAGIPRDKPRTGKLFKDNDIETALSLFLSPIFTFFTNSVAKRDYELKRPMNFSTTA